jgi:hypothetical protein
MSGGMGISGETLRIAGILTPGWRISIKSTAKSNRFLTVSLRMRRLPPDLEEKIPPPISENFLATTSGIAQPIFPKSRLFTSENVKVQPATTSETVRPAIT